MGDSGRYSLIHLQLDINQILLEAQQRWLRPTEICEILQNYRKFRLAKEPPNRPPSGSLFLFDRKVVRYFRRDGHNWRKKKDGRTVKEAHERLKAGSIDVLQCYYAHGEENENFHRRSYWMLEEELSNIVFVHYREVKGGRTNFDLGKNADSSQTKEDGYNTYEVLSSSASTFQLYHRQGVSQVTDATTFNSLQSAEEEDAESGIVQEYRNHLASPGLNIYLDNQPAMPIGVRPVPCYPLLTNGNYQGKFSPTSCVNFKSLIHGETNEVPVSCSSISEAQQDLNAQTSQNHARRNNPSTIINGHEDELLNHVTSGVDQKNQSCEIDKWQVFDYDAQCKGKCSEDERSDRDLFGQSFRQPLLDDLASELNNANDLDFDLMSLMNSHTNGQSTKPIQLELELQVLNVEGGSLRSVSENNHDVEADNICPSMKKPPREGIQGDLEKVDSFDRWMSKELGDVAVPSSHPSSAAYWEVVENEGDDSGVSVQVPADNYSLGPSLSQEQLFTIIDFSPNFAYMGSDVKVLVRGRFLMGPDDVREQKWACMFGEFEVPAEIISDGVLQCHMPSGASGRVPFYITCSNRLACSEIREFEFRRACIDDMNLGDIGSSKFDETLLHMKLGKLLSLESNNPLTSVQPETSQLCNKISALLKDDNEWEQMINLAKHDEQKGKDLLLQKLLKEMLHLWLLQKISEGGNGASTLDESGQGVLHFAAALGYDWAIAPTILAGVGVNFRDVNGWTALHWAAFCGRERMVAFLISLGANPGTLTDPTAKTAGRTPADLASSNGHKGMAGYLAESALSSHVSSLDLDRTKDENKTSKADDDNIAHGSLKESLAAVHNATMAVARIHQVYRIQSFQRKLVMEYGDSEFGISGDGALSLLALRSKKSGQHSEPLHAAAIRIQNKFRGWKGRKDFILVRQRIIKIQALVRGHQVRKHYRKIIWSIRFLDRVVLRWKRKGRGLSAFKPTNQEAEDDLDFMKEGRKQSEERLQKALSRVKSMVQYPAARDQYGRLLTVVSEMQEMKETYDRILHNPEADFEEDLIHLDAFLDDDTFGGPGESGA